MKNTRVLTEGALLASVFAILLAITTYVPLLGMITVWALPLPFVVYTYRRGLKAGLLFWVVAFFLAFVIGGLVTVPSTLIFGSGGIIVGELYRRKLSGFGVLIGASLVYTANALLMFLVLVLILGENPMQMAIDLTREQMELAQSTLGSFGQTTDQLEQAYELINNLVYLAPVMIVGMGVTLALITKLLSYFLLKRLGHQVNPLPPFREWSFPKAFLWYYLIILILAMIGAEEGTTMFMVIWNLFPLLEIIIAVQGLAVIFYYFYQKKVTTVVPIVILVAAILLPPLLYIIRIIGIIDLGFDLRKRISGQKK
ncbi:YybS family protein [Halalkalibacter alkaliphilus]|uniref:YybS family protein n=1 Tax=Halalkalibacter alkaliphilus TaxID=2917993 RepID=A0A9X2I4H2_9BACI|nr:YybS family protein [Halalkalibacter alkaliphilus]MCL7747488.1 YybS family protein [Halalkalibacter alkaliphilus]